MRRDGAVPFFVYYEDEIYTDDKHDVGDMHIFHKTIRDDKLRWWGRIYSLEEKKNPYVSYYVLVDFLKIKKIPVTKEEKDLLWFKQLSILLMQWYTISIHYVD